MEEHRLRKLNGPNREEDTRDWRRQRNEGLRELCCAAERNERGVTCVTCVTCAMCDVCDMCGRKEEHTPHFGGET